MATKYALQLTTREGVYFVDATTGEFLSSPDGYEIIRFGSESQELPDLGSIQAKSEAQTTNNTTKKTVQNLESGGSGDIMSRRTPRDDVLRPMNDRRPVVNEKGIATTAGGLLGSMAMRGVGAAIGGAIGGPIGAMAGGLLGGFAGRKAGAFAINDMRTNPQTMALPGKTTKSASKPASQPETPRSNPLMAPRTAVERAPLGAPGTTTTRNPVTVSQPTRPGQYNPMVSPLTFEDVEFPPMEEKAPFVQPQRPVTPTPVRNNPLMSMPNRPGPVHNLPAAPLGAVTQGVPLASVDPLTGMPVDPVTRGPLPSISPLPASPVSGITRGALPSLDPVTGVPVGAVTRGAPLANVDPLRASPVGQVTRAPMASLASLPASPVGQVGRSALAPVTPTFSQPMNPNNRAAPSYAQTPAGANVPSPTSASRPSSGRSNPLMASSVGKVTTEDQQVNPMTRAQSRQVLPTLDYDRFSRTTAPSVNWGNINPDDLDAYTRNKVEEAQSKLDFSLNITSGFRDTTHNARVGGAKNSAHSHAQAVDVGLKGLNDSQRTAVVAAFGSVSESGKGRIGAYSGNTALHYDTREHATTKYGGIHPMYDTTINKLDKAPGWFTSGVNAVTTKDYSVLNPHTPRNAFTPEAIAATTSPRSAAANVRGPTPGSYTNTPGTYTSSGMFSRDQKTREDIGFTIAGELSGKTLKGLERNDPVARAELANVVATMENRAHSTRHNGKMDSVLSPSQYNSLTESGLKATRANWGGYGTSIMGAVNDYYSGVNKPTTPDATHYANYDIVTPSWDTHAKNKTKVGDHTFSTVTIPGTQRVEYTPEVGFQSKFDQAIRDEVNKQTKVGFDAARTALDPFTRRDEIPEDEPKSTKLSSTMTAGYPGATGISRTMAQLNGTTGLMGVDPWGSLRGVGMTTTRSGMNSLGVPSSYAGGMTNVSDGRVSYSRADGSTRNPDGTAYDPWGGMRNTGVMGGGSGGSFGSGTVSDSGRDAASKNSGGGGGLY